ncbi:MAG: phage tail protein, partial [Acidimicrobiia bacterium]
MERRSEHAPNGDEKVPTPPSRRGFLVGAAGLTGVAATAGAWRSPVLADDRASAQAQSSPTADQRSYVTGHFALDLDGAFAGPVLAAAGGSAFGDVVVAEPAGSPFRTKHIGGVKYEDISVQVGHGMSKGFYDWIKTTADGKPTRRSGALIAADFNYREISRLTFHEAILTELGMPALDAASKDAAKMTLKFAPESTRRSSGSGAKVPASSRKDQKKWLPANFRLKIDGLEAACTKVNKIEAIIIKQAMVEAPVGDGREHADSAGGLTLSDLVVSLAESFAEPFYAWHEDFVIKGNSTDDREKGGTLEFLSSDNKTVLFSLAFSNLGIFRLTQEPQDSAQSIRRVKAEMYVERIAF